jgi:hypothetical protein
MNEVSATNKILFALYTIQNDIGISNRNTWAGEFLHPCEYYRSYAFDMLTPLRRSEMHRPKPSLS